MGRARAQGLIRGDDAVARLGGDEFALLLADTGPQGATEIAERVRTALAERIDASPGVATFPEDGPGLEALIQAADRRLYAGRRRRGLAGAR